MAKTKKPTGLSITRSGSNYTIKWKLAEKYKGGQTLQYRIKGKTSWSKWYGVSVGATTSSKTIKLDKTNYYPYKSSYLTAVEFRVKGKAKKKATSDWSNVTFILNSPSNPTVSGSLGDQWNISNFTFSIDSKDGDSRQYSQYEWQTIIVKESTVTDGSKLSWGSNSIAWGSGTGTATAYTKTFTEDTTLLSSGSCTRWFRVRAKGVAGYSDWRYAKHVFAVPFEPTIVSTEVVEKSSNYLVDVKWEANTNPAHPIDETTVEYATGIPTANMQPPVSPSWKEVNTSKDTQGTDEAVFYTEGKLDDDECLYVHVVSSHEGRETQSVAELAKKGKLADPSGLTVTINDNIATVRASNNSTACTYTGADSTVKRLFLQVIYKDNKEYEEGINIGIIPYGEDEAEIVLPTSIGTSGSISASIDSNGHLIFDDAEQLDLSLREGHLIATEVSELAFEIGVKAVVGTYTYETKADSSRRYKINPEMESANTLWYGGTLPQAPTGVRYSFDNKLTLYWNWTWGGADSAEISWSENPNAWESTEEPQTYTINRQVNRWTIDELEAGNVYYIRVRLFNKEAEVYGPYSDMLEVRLTTPPLKPVLTLSDGTITEDGKVTVSWNYNSGDGTEQSYAEVLCNGEIIAHALSEKYVTIYSKEQGWAGGNEYPLTLRVKSESGSFSDFSDPVSVLIAVPLEAVIESTSLEDVTITDDEEETRTVLSLTEMPLTIEVGGANENSVVTVAVERAEAYRIDRPDENAFDGYKGETIFLDARYGGEPFVVELDELIGALDDGAKYKIVATIRDDLEQRSDTELDFEVHWAHKATEPEGEIAIDGAIAKITPIAPEGALETDVCDIYRLSTDKPELIYPNAEFGSTIVDPYPSINGGYRLVCKTENGDYITEENEPAWLDVESGFEYNKAIIDFGTDSVEFYYNVDTSHNWTKNFKVTEYLGGAVQGDWNPAVSRDGTLSSLVLKPFEPETVEALRRLAVYSGICNVRTLDGSSFHANVDVSETNPHERYGKISEFSLNITRVDGQGYDGVSLEAWED